MVQINRSADFSHWQLLRHADFELRDVRFRGDRKTWWYIASWPYADRQFWDWRFPLPIPRYPQIGSRPNQVLSARG